jgi:hypothetical protein
MHNRLAHRACVAVDVAVHHNGVNLGKFRTRDIDARAVFIEAADCGLQQQDVVEMRFVVQKGAPRRFKRKGVVIRRADEGIVVAFVTTDTSFFQAVEALLTGARPKEVATDGAPLPGDQSAARQEGAGQRCGHIEQRSSARVVDFPTVALRSQGGRVHNKP